jgi:hypothetical protein
MIPAIFLSVSFIGGEKINRPAANKVLSFCLIVLMLCGCWFGTACGAGSASQSSSGTPETPAGTYNVTVTGNAGNITHSASLSLTVQ